MGTRGPVPKRESERTRRNLKSEDGLELKRGTAYGVPRFPDPPEHWRDEVKDWWASLPQSGMFAFFESTDVAQARIIGDALHEFYSRPPGSRSWQMIDTVLKHSAALGTTEGERRRIRIELEPAAPEEKSASQKAKDRWKNNLSQPASNIVPLGTDVEETPLDPPVPGH